MKFIDRLTQAIAATDSVLVAGIDPRLDDLPGFVINEAKARHSSFSDQAEYALSSYLDRVLNLVAGKVSCVKPNLAFFEQYGVGGLKAFAFFMKRAREIGVLTIADAKRGDIGSTAQAYSAAFLGRVKAFGESHAVFDADALTVSPYLGFDTIEEFIKDCRTFEKGLFILVKTSNPGSADLQNVVGVENKERISERVARFIASRSEELAGDQVKNMSGLGAVVGATYPAEAQNLRALMPTSIFLIPGYGAQGGSANDALAGFIPGGSPRSGGVVNSSRGIFALPTASTITPDEFDSHVALRIEQANQELNRARTAQE